MTTTFTHHHCLFSFLSLYFHTIQRWKSSFFLLSTFLAYLFFHRPPSLSLLSFLFAFKPFYVFLISQLCFVSCTTPHTALLLRFFPHRFSVFLLQSFGLPVSCTPYLFTCLLTVSLPYYFNLLCPRLPVYHCVPVTQRPCFSLSNTFPCTKVLVNTAAATNSCVRSFYPRHLVSECTSPILLSKPNNFTWFMVEEGDVG